MEYAWLLIRHPRRPSIFRWALQMAYREPGTFKCICMLSENVRVNMNSSCMYVEIYYLILETFPTKTFNPRPCTTWAHKVLYEEGPEVHMSTDSMISNPSHYSPWSQGRWICSRLGKRELGGREENEGDRRSGRGVYIEDVGIRLVLMGTGS